MLENQSAKPGNQWEGWEVCVDGAKVKFCQLQWKLEVVSMVLFC